MADNKVLRIEDDGAVRLLTLDRPEAKNAFNGELYRAVRQALDEAADDDSVTVCVITGAGDVFSGGQDLKALANLKDNPEEARGFDPFTRSLAAFDKPLLAAVNGPAVGVGTTLLPHCDLVLVSDTARFKLPFVALGLVPEAGSSLLLPAVLGPQAAAYYLLTGDWIEADEAVARGLAWKRCAPETLLEETLTLARRIAAAPLDAVRNTKRLLQAGRADAITAAFDREVAHLEGIVSRFLAS
ncbi:MAG TPA: enoyl-CoA hydratase-related protein [Acidimicrobiia bacterium]|nr:enoyl-CoA hydratase-related protein [Acidimicrobiia bacterium]